MVFFWFNSRFHKRRHQAVKNSPNGAATRFTGGKLYIYVNLNFCDMIGTAADRKHCVLSGLFQLPGVLKNALNWRHTNIFEYSFVSAGTLRIK